MEQIDPEHRDKYTVTYFEPEYHVIIPQPLTFRQKLALEWIIFKAWVKRVLNL